MGLFTPGFLKEGKGVDKNAPEKNRFFLFFELFFGHLSKLISVNFVYFFTMLPLFLGIGFSFDFTKWPFPFSGYIPAMILLAISVFTSFPMTAGFTFVIRNMQRREHAWIIRDMFKHAKLNYKKAAINGAVQIAMYMLFYIAFVTYRYNIGGTFGYMLSWLMIVFSLIFMWMQFYVNLMIVTFDLTLKQIYKNAFIFAMAKMPVNLLITILCAAIIILCLWYIAIPLNIILLLVIYLSLFGFITIYGIYPSVDKIMITKNDESSDSGDVQ